MIIALDEYEEYCTECCFYRISEKAGFKLFFHKKDAMYSWRNQKLAYEHGIAPRVGKSVRKVDKYFGHFVELVELIGDLPYDLLKEKFKEVFGFYHEDDHDNNIGIKNGKPVFIDFGRMMDPKTTWSYYNNKTFHFLRAGDA